MKLFDFLVFIDDDVATNYYHEHILNEYDICNTYKFFLCAEEALAYFKEHKDCPKFRKPDIIFSDVNMPRLDGWDFVRSLSEIDTCCEIDIYMLTTSSNPYEMQKVDGFPCVKGFREKPLSREMLESIVSLKKV